MKCPKCNLDLDFVIDTYPSSPTQFRRRRECRGCGYRFTTREDIVMGDPLKANEIDGYAGSHPMPFKQHRKDVCDARGVVVASTISKDMAKALTNFLNYEPAK